MFLWNPEKLQKALFEGSDKYKLAAVENCGLPNERIFYNSEEIPDKLGYFTIIIAVNDEVN